MSLNAGSVTVDGTTGALGGTGLAYAMAQALDAYVITTFGGANPAPTGTGLAEFRRGIAGVAGAFATAIVSHLTANAVCHVTISTSQGGLQTDPDSGDPTNPPSATKTLTGSLS